MKENKIRPAPHRTRRIILYYVGLVVLGLAGLHLFAIATAMVYGEWRVMLDFLISAAVSVLVAGACILPNREGGRAFHVDWGTGMAVASIAWMLCMLLAAVPYQLSGHFLSYLDACFDVMSGFTTTGLVLIQDLDHASMGLNMWRHLLTFVGGAGYGGDGLVLSGQRRERRI